MRQGSIALRPVITVFLAVVAFLVVINFAITSPKKTTNTNLVACTLEAKICPDGTTVGRHGSKCEFDPCPTNTNTAVTNNNTNISTATPAGQPTIIYYLEKGSVTDTNTGQDWPTYDLVKVVNNGAPKLLTTFGKVNEAPRNFVLSPDKKWLGVDVQDRALIINLTTNTLEKSYTAQRDIAGIVFSQDSQKVLIWDQKDGDNDKSYSVHSILLATMEDTVIGRGKTEQAFSTAAWRADGNVVLMHYYYPTGSIHIYHPTTNKITQTEDVNSLVSLISPSGKLYSLVTKNVNDLCNDYSGSAFSSFTVKDTETSTIVGTFGDGVRANSFITFSPDDTEVLFSSQAIPANRDLCAARTTTYYRQKLGGQPVEVKSADVVEAEWGQKQVDISSQPVGDANSGQTREMVNGQDWHLPSGTTIIKSFYTQ